MAQIAQVQITFVAGEDRLLMRLATDSEEEFRFWLTRRFVKALRPYLDQKLSEQPRIKTQANPQARRELLKFEQQQAVAQSDFETPYRADSKNLPLGKAPILLTRFQLRGPERGNITLTLAPEQGAGIDLALNPALMHSVVALLDKAVASADWTLPDAATAGLEPAVAPGSQQLN